MEDRPVGEVFTDAEGQWRHIGHGVAIQTLIGDSFTVDELLTLAPGVLSPDRSPYRDQPIGFALRHPCVRPPHGRHPGLVRVQFDTPAAHFHCASGGFWELINTQPLHVEPGISCLSCGLHGHVRDGRWQPC